MKRRILRYAVTLSLLAAVIWYVNVQHLLDLMSRMQVSYGLPALALLLIQNDLATRRWATMLRAFGAGPRFFQLLRIQYSALFAQLFLPTSIGAAAVRTGLLFRTGMPIGVAINSVVLDRLVALGGLVLMAAAFMPVIAASVSFNDGPRNLIIVSAAIVIACVFLIHGILRYRPLSYWLDLLKRTPARHLVQPFEQAAAKIYAPGRLVRALVFSLSGQIAAICAVFVLARGGGLQVHLLDCILVMPPVMLLAALPISIAGWGVRESAMVIAFGLLGVSNEAALALSLQYAAIGYVCAIPGALGWIVETDRKGITRQSVFDLQKMNSC